MAMKPATSRRHRSRLPPCSARWPQSSAQLASRSSNGTRNVQLKADADFQFRGIERRVLDLLAVPLAPEVPEGSAESIRVFRAGENYYTWSLLVWAARGLLLGAALAAVTIA